MRTRRIATTRRRGILLCAAGLFLLGGCYNTPPDRYDVSRSPAPLRTPAPDQFHCDDSYEDSLTGGKVFSMYCAYCHNARPLAERPFAHYKNVAAHMRVRVNLTGKEYAKLMAFLREVQDVPSPTPPVEPSPKRFFFSQPIAELRERGSEKGATPGQADGDKRPQPAGQP
jgi:hypothetical protein